MATVEKPDEVLDGMPQRELIEAALHKAVVRLVALPPKIDDAFTSEARVIAMEE